jgi:hypothetical protein
MTEFATLESPRLDESRLTAEEREELEGLRKQLWNAQQGLEPWRDPQMRFPEGDSGYERALAALRNVEIELAALEAELREKHRP